MLLNDIVTRIKDRSHRGDPTITSDEITAQILRAVNDARRDLVRYLPKHFLRKDATSPLIVTNPTVLYSLASDVMDPIIFRYTFNNVEYIMERIASEREFYLNLYIKTQGPNRPFFYVEKGLDGSGNRQIEVYPIPLPSTTFTVNYTYFKDPTKTELTTSDLSTEFPDFPSYMQDALWKGGLFYFLTNFDDPLRATAEADYRLAKQQLDEIEDSDQDMELSLRWGVTRSLQRRDPATGIKLI